MTIAPLSADTAAIVAQFGGQQQATVDLMIGVGVDKNSEAVYFKYEGDEETTALVLPSGKPVTRIGNVRLTGLTIDNDVYKEKGFVGSKLNVFLQVQNGTTVLLTSGLTTYWSQCLITALMGLYASSSMDHLISIDTWKGERGLRPCFAAVRDGSVKVTSNDIYDALKEARSDKDKVKMEAILRDSVELMSAALGQLMPEQVVVEEVSQF